MVFGLLPNLGPTELLLILIIVVVIFGGSKLAGLGKALGQSIKEFKMAVKETDEEKKSQEEKA